MRGKKTDIVTIIFALTLVVIIFIIVIITILSGQGPKTRQIITESPSSVTPAPTPTSTSNVLQYNATASQKLLDYFDNRRTLTPADVTAKANILSLLPTGEQSGVIYQTATINVEYVHSADIFLVEIATTNIQLAKSEAAAWFEEHGISQQGICTLPVEFYMNYDTANQLRTQNIIFNPLPEGC